MNLKQFQWSTYKIFPITKALFSGFMKLGLMGFGGVLPLAHRLIVEDQKWLNAEEFTNLLGVCQILPGGNIVNITSCNWL